VRIEVCPRAVKAHAACGSTAIAPRDRSFNIRKYSHRVAPAISVFSIGPNLIA